MPVHLGEKEHKLLLYTEKLYAIIGSSYFIVKVGYANHHTGIFLFALVVRFVTAVECMDKIAHAAATPNQAGYGDLITNLRSPF